MTGIKKTEGETLVVPRRSVFDSQKSYNFATLQTGERERFGRRDIKKGKENRTRESVLCGGNKSKVLPTSAKLCRPFELALGFLNSVSRTTAVRRRER